MMFHRRTSFFPLILALLTLVLGLLMFYAFTGRSIIEQAAVTVVTPVSSQEYNNELKTLMQSFIVDYPQKYDDISRLVLIEQTLQKLLSLRVPAESKETHLNLAVELNQMQQALKEKNGEENEAFARIQSYVPN